MERPVDSQLDRYGHLACPAIHRAVLVVHKTEDIGLSGIAMD